MNNPFVGLSLIADCIDFRKPEIVAFVLAGYYDDILLETFYYTANHKLSTKGEHKTDRNASFCLINLKDRIRDCIHHILHEADRQDRVNRELALARLKAELCQSNKPHEMGTVAEIAAKYNISKSEVRRRKAEGTLNELIQM